MTYDIITRARSRTRRRLAIGATVVLAMLGVATVLVGYALRPGVRAGTTSPTQSPGVSVGATPQASGAVSFGDVTWSDLDGAALPLSAQAGPRDTASGLARGFSHDPAGAVLAAVHLLVRVSAQVGPDVFGPTRDCTDNG